MYASAFSMYNTHMLSLQLDPSKLHHAYVITSASLAKAKTEIEKFVVEKMKIPFQGNPDVFVGEYGSIGIEDLQDAISMHQRVPIGPKKVIVILGNGISMQAQNSILKMIEEPTANTHFFIAFPTVSMLLPTVLSRVHVIDIGGGEESHDPRVKKFLSSSVSLRLDMVKEMIADLDKERVTKEDIFQFVSAVLESAHSKDKSADNLSVIARASDYLRDPSSSIKMILEYISLRIKKI